MDPLTREIEQRLRAIYARLARGDDLPPGMRLRLEGLLEAAVIVGERSAEELLALVDAVHREALGESPAARYGEDWQQRFPFPQFPAWQARAPVTPTTDD